MLKETASRYKYYKDRLAWFMEIMTAKLIQNDHKGRNWELDDPVILLNRVNQEVDEVFEAMLREASPEEVSAECADVGNIIFMVAEAYIRLYNEKHPS